MISNFLSAEDRNNFVKIKIPAPPSLFDPTLVFCFGLCLCGLIAVARQGEWLGVVVLGLILLANILLSVSKFCFGLKIRRHYKNIKIIHRIFDTPAMTEKNGYIEFLFISPSENILQEIEKTSEAFMSLQK
jgi:hypothetical protein